MFRFQLAKSLGMTVAELNHRVDSRELSEWRAYDRLRPLDEARRLEVQLARLTAIYVNAHIDHDKERAVTLPDYLPQFGEKYIKEIEQQKEDELTDDERQQRLEAKINAMAETFVKRGAK